MRYVVAALVALGLAGSSQAAAPRLANSIQSREQGEAGRKAVAAFLLGSQTG